MIHNLFSVWSVTLVLNIQRPTRPRTFFVSLLVPIGDLSVSCGVVRPCALSPACLVKVKSVKMTCNAFTTVENKPKCPFYSSTFNVIRLLPCLAVAPVAHVFGMCSLRTIRSFWKTLYWLESWFVSSERLVHFIRSFDLQAAMNSTARLIRAPLVYWLQKRASCIMCASENRSKHICLELIIDRMVQEWMPVIDY